MECVVCNAHSEQMSACGHCKNLICSECISKAKDGEHLCDFCITRIPVTPESSSSYEMLKEEVSSKSSESQEYPQVESPAIFHDCEELQTATTHNISPTQEYSSAIQSPEANLSPDLHVEVIRAGESECDKSPSAARSIQNPIFAVSEDNATGIVIEPEVGADEKHNNLPQDSIMLACKQIHSFCISLFQHRREQQQHVNPEFILNESKTENACCMCSCLL